MLGYGSVGKLGECKVGGVVIVGECWMDVMMWECRRDSQCQ